MGKMNFFKLSCTTKKYIVASWACDITKLMFSKFTEIYTFFFSREQK